MQDSCLALADEAVWSRSLFRPAVATPLQLCSHVHAAEPVEPAAAGGVQQTLLLLTEQVSRLASRTDSLTQAVQAAPAAEKGPALQGQTHLKEVMQQELRPSMEQILHRLPTQTQPARSILPAPAMSEAVQQALVPHLNSMAAQQQQQLADATASFKVRPRIMLEHISEQPSAQQHKPVLQQLMRQPLHRSPNSSASDAAYSGQLGSSHILPAGSYGGGCSALLLSWLYPCRVHMLVASLLRNTTQQTKHNGLEALCMCACLVLAQGSIVPTCSNQCLLLCRAPGCCGSHHQWSATSQE